MYRVHDAGGAGTYSVSLLSYLFLANPSILTGLILAGGECAVLTAYTASGTNWQENSTECGKYRNNVLIRHT